MWIFYCWVPLLDCGSTWVVTVVSVITTFHWAISFWSAWLTNSACADGLFLTFKAKASNDIPSRIVDIHIQIHARVLASFLSEAAITIAKMKSKAHSHAIAHRIGWFSLFIIPKTISKIHLINAHRANIQIINVHTNWDQEKMSKNQIKISKNPIIHRNDIDLTFWFLNVLIIAAVPAKIKKNHRMMSINFQKTLGQHIVIIQDMIIIIAKDISNQNGQVCFVSEFAITLKNKVKFSFGYIVIS